MRRTRTEEIERARREKEASVQPERVSSFENVMLQFKNRKIMERVTAGYNGLRAQIGSMATGSGFAAGPDFLREDLADGRIRISGSAAISTNLWQKYQAGIVLPRLGAGRFSLGFDAARRDYRSLEFYGMGIDSSRRNRSDYRLEDTSVDATAAFWVARHVRVGEVSVVCGQTSDGATIPSCPERKRCSTIRPLPAYSARQTSCVRPLRAG